MMLNDPAGDGGQNRIDIVHKPRGRPRPQPNFAVNDAQPIGSGCAGQYIRLAGEGPAVGEVIHWLGGRGSGGGGRGTEVGGQKVSVSDAGVWALGWGAGARLSASGVWSRCNDRLSVDRYDVDVQRGRVCRVCVV